MRWLLALGLIFSASVTSGADESESSTERQADALLIGIPAVAFGLTFLLSGDEPGAGLGLREGWASLNGSPRHDLGMALLRTGAITYGLKATVNEERPNGEEGSFPSGHTSISFAGAEFIRKEYGWRWGAPAYAAASYVGWSRVETDDHWTHDVVVGALIGVLSNHDISDLRTRWGDWRIEPALLQAPAPAAALNAPDDSGLALGLRFKVDF